MKNRYKEKPKPTEIVEAEQWNGQEHPDVKCYEHMGLISKDGQSVKVYYLIGDPPFTHRQYINLGDYIVNCPITGNYVISKEQFEEEYELLH